MLKGNPERAGLLGPSRSGKAAANKVTAKATEGKNVLSKTVQTAKPNLQDEVKITPAENPPKEPKVEHNKNTVRFNSKDEALLKMHTHESLELEVPRRCPNCKACPTCQKSMMEKTAQESFDEELQRKTIKCGNTHSKLYKGDYLWILDKLGELPTNEKAALISQQQLEKKLTKLGPESLEAFNNNMEEGFKFGNYRWKDDIKK